MDIDDFVGRVQAASGDPQRLTLVTLDLVLSVQAPGLQAVFEAAAIPHWFDAAILAQMLSLDQATAETYVESLSKLPMVEPFEKRKGWNVHEATRLAVRRELSASNPDRFRELSAVASQCFPGDEDHKKIESLYHRLIANPVQGGIDLADLRYAWFYAGRFEPLQALAQTLSELLKSKSLAPSAHARCAIYLGSIEKDRRPVAEVKLLAKEALTLLPPGADDVAELDAHDLLGDVLLTQGLNAEALKEYLANKRLITNRLTKEDPDHFMWQRELSVALIKIGDIYDAQGQSSKAFTEYQDCLNIRQRLVDQRPDREDWQRDLSIAHNKIGDVYTAKHRPAEALREYQAFKTISEQLLRRDPGNLGRQHVLSVAHNKIGSVYELQQRLTEALVEYEAEARIMEGLVHQDPDNAEWQRELSTAKVSIGGVCKAQNEMSRALTEYQSAIIILQRLTHQDSDNTGWQLDLSVVHNNIGNIQDEQGRHSEALEEYAASRTIIQRLAEQDPSNARWQRELSISCFNAAWLDEVANRISKAREGYSLAATRLQKLVDLDSQNKFWQADLDLVLARLKNLDEKHPPVQTSEESDL